MLRVPPRSQHQQRKPKSAANEGGLLALQAQSLHNNSRTVTSKSHNTTPSGHKKGASLNFFHAREISQATTTTSTRPATSHQHIRGHIGKLYPLKKKWLHPEKCSKKVSPEKAPAPSDRDLKLPNPNQNTALVLKKKHTFNLHNNFLNLNPEYDVRKYNRVKALAGQWKKIIGNYLVDEVTALARKNFNEFLAKGGKLTYSELRRLNSVWKDDYVNHITKTDEQASQYISLVKVQSKNAQHEASELVWDMQDQRKDWDREMEKINENIVKNAVANGLNKESFQKYNFVEFNILDMYKLDDGTMCYLCKKNLRCQRHGLRKRPIKTKDADFDRE